MRTSYRTGIIGLGQIAYGIDNDSTRSIIWSHAKAYGKHPQTEIVAICDADPAKLLEVREALNGPNCYSDYRQMLAAEDLDIVSICTPTATHLDVVRTVVDMGAARAVFCEKPVAYYAEEIRALAELCDEKEIVHAVNYMRRWDTKYRYIKEQLDTEDLGAVQTVVAYGATALFTSTSHLLDTVLYFCGQPLWVSGDLQRDFVRQVHGREDPGGIGFIHFANGAFGFLKGTSHSPYKYMFEVDILCANGRLRIADDGRSLKKWSFGLGNTSSGYGYEALTETEPIDIEENERMLMAIDEIVGALEGGDMPASNFISAEGVVRVINLIEQSANCGSAPQVF